MTPNRLRDPEYLRTAQYQNDSHLQKRIAIHQRYGTNQQSLYHWLFEQMHFPETAHVLELGCGNGSFWEANLPAVPDDIDLTLTDLSSGMLADAHNRLDDCLLHTSLVADAQHLPFADASFDVVIANYMLYHVPDTESAITEIRRVMKPSGSLYAATNGLHHMRELLELAPDYRADELVMRQFALENGTEQLASAFDHVERRDFIDHLEVTEAQPVIDYIESTSATGPLNSDGLDRITGIVEQAIARSGAFHVHKSTGLFIASGSAG